MERGTKEYRNNERKRKKWKERTDKCGRREINEKKSNK
jgi:hypothetical protein